MVQSDAAEQGRMEPAPVLIAALEVNVGGPWHIRGVSQHGGLA